MAAVPVSAEPPEEAVVRLARSLGLDPAKVAEVLRQHRLAPADAFALVLQGGGEERVERLAHDLHVSRPRLALALLDSTVQAASASGMGARAGAALQSARERATEWLVEVAEFVLETLAESIPRTLNRIVFGLAVLGVAAMGLGIVALVDRDLFFVVAIYALGAFLVLGGAALVWLAWRIHEATATLRTLARVAKRWRARWNAFRGEE